MLALEVWLNSNYQPDPLAGLCEVLEEMGGHNVLETLSFEILVDDHETENFIGSAFQK